MNQMSQVRALRDVASLIDGGETLEAMLQRLIEAACQHAGWVMGSIMAIDTQEGYGQVMVRHDPTLIAARLPERWKLISSPALAALKRNEPILISDAQLAEQYPGYLQDARDRDYRTVLVMPMPCQDGQGRPMVLTVISRQVKEVAEEDLAFLGAIIHLGSIAVGREHRRIAQLRATEQLGRALSANRRLLDHVLDDGSAATLAEMIGVLLGDPVLMVDFSDNQILAGQSPDRTVFSDEDWHTAASGPLARQILRAAQQGNASGPLKLADAGRQITLTARIEPLSVGQHPAGALFVFTDRDLSEALLDSARLALGVQFMRNALRFRSAAHALTDLIRDLVEARWRTEADLQARASHVGLNLRVPQRMIVLDTPELVTAAGGGLAEFRRILARAVPAEAAAAVAVALDDRIACLLPEDSDFRRNRMRGFADLLAAEMNQALGRAPAVVLGGICTAPADYAAVWQRCSRLIGIGRSFGLGGVLSADAAGPIEMLASALDAGELRDYVGNSIGPVMQYDRDHATDYLDTLRAYLRAGCRSQPCADAMGLHVSTLRYRLARMRELFGIEIDSPEKRFDLELAIRLQMITQSL